MWLFRQRRAAATDKFDLKYGTDTRGVLPIWKLNVSSPNVRFAASYQGLGEQAIIDAVRFLGEDPRQFTFVDIGCGKGRALLVAARLGFRQVIGVEFAPGLVDVAAKNLEKMQVTNAELARMDAAEYRFPDSDLVVYLFNPFSHEVMAKVIANLQLRAGKRLYVIFAAPKPECIELLDQSGFLQRVGCPPGRDYIQVWRSLALN